MRNVNRKLAAGVIVLFIIVVWALVMDVMNHWFSDRWFAFQAKRSVNPAELQQWATNMLAKHGRFGGSYTDADDTNMPSSLRKLMPNVMITDPDEVWVFASKGGPYLVVGARSLATPSNQNIFPWKPGMYFVR